MSAYIGSESMSKHHGENANKCNIVFEKVYFTASQIGRIN